MNAKLSNGFLVLGTLGLVGLTFGYLPHQWFLQLKQQPGGAHLLPWTYYLLYILPVLAILFSVFIWQSKARVYVQIPYLRPSSNVIIAKSILVSTLIFGVVPCIFIYRRTDFKPRSYMIYNGACFTSSVQISPLEDSEASYALQCGESGNIQVFLINSFDFEGSDDILRYPGMLYHCEISNTGKAVCDASTSPRSDP